MRIAANCILTYSVVFWSAPWAVTTVTDVHCTFAPAETRTWRMCTCLCSCMYSCHESCVVTGHRSGQDAHMDWKPALPVYQSNHLCFKLCLTRSSEPSCFLILRSPTMSSDNKLPPRSQRTLRSKPTAPVTPIGSESDPDDAEEEERWCWEKKVDHSYACPRIQWDRMITINKVKMDDDERKEIIAAT